MRKDVVFGMSIGGLLLAIGVVYLTLSPSHKSKTTVQLDPGNGEVSEAGNGEGGEPVTATDRTGENNLQPGSGRNSSHAGGDITGGVDGTQNNGAQNNGSQNTTAGTGRATGEGPMSEAERKWHEKLYGTPLMSVSQNPGNTDQNSGGDQSATARQPVTIAMANTIQPSPGDVSAGTLGTTSQARTSTTPAAHPVSGVTMRQHRVQTGETFSSIAAAAYGSSSYYSHIVRANPGIDARRLRPGMQINLPDLADVKPAETSEPVTNAVVSPTIPSATRAAALSPVVAGKEYRVQGGDSLHKIATKLYGTISMVQPIYEANKEKIGADPAKLKLGMVLKLPQPPVTAKQ